MSAGGRLEAVFTPPAVSVTVTNSGGAGVVVSIVVAAYTITTFCAHLQARLNAGAPPSSGSWTVSVSTGPTGTGLVSINCTGTWSLTFTTTELGTLLGFAGNIASGTGARTGTQNARGLWLPKCPMVMSMDPRRAPEETDAHATENPDGNETVTLLSTFRYRHSGIVWKYVPGASTFAGREATPYASFQSWLRDTQWGRGHAWFGIGSAFQAYWDNGGTDAIVGADLNSGSGPTNGWHFSPPIASMNPTMAVGGWVELWTIAVPPIVTGDG